MAGVCFRIAHPAWAFRDCGDCRRYIFSKGQLYCDRKGNPIRNPAPPRCEDTPCKSREEKPRLSERHRRLLALWQLVRATGNLPSPGALLDQDPALLRAFALLADLDQHVSEGKEKAFAQLGALGALLR